MRSRTRDHDGADQKPGRYEKCENCGRTWNVSRRAVPYAGVYVCPECAKRMTTPRGGAEIRAPKNDRRGVRGDGD